MPDIDTRPGWLGLLAMAPPARVAELADPLIAQERFDVLRAPEVGLVMAQARIDGRGDRFNLAEVPVTRCTVRSRNGHAGVGYRLGRCPDAVARIARLDALLQQPEWAWRIRERVLEPLNRELAAARRAEQATTATSRVSFDTLAPESNP